MLFAGKIVQWVRKLANVAIPIPTIYRLLGQTLALLEKEEDPQRFELLSLIFRAKLLSQLGLKPRIETCVRCEKVLGGPQFFDIASGGSICEMCSQGSVTFERPYLGVQEREFLIVADRFKLTSWPSLHFPQEKTSTLIRLLTQFAAYHTHTQLPL
jgi:recombinational DNA repair protein (RecF pathway)